MSKFVHSAGYPGGIDFTYAPCDTDGNPHPHIWGWIVSDDDPSRLNEAMSYGFIGGMKGVGGMHEVLLPDHWGIYVPVLRSLGQSINTYSRRFRDWGAYFRPGWTMGRGNGYLRMRVSGLHALPLGGCLVRFKNRPSSHASRLG